MFSMLNLDLSDQPKSNELAATEFEHLINEIAALWELAEIDAQADHHSI